jgi:hypothetical protein
MKDERLRQGNRYGRSHFILHPSYFILHKVLVEQPGVLAWPRLLVNRGGSAARGNTSDAPSSCAFGTPIAADIGATRKAGRLPLVKIPPEAVTS